MDHLEILDAHGRRRRVELGRPRLLIGREPACDICLPHPSVSRRHAQLQQTDDGAWVLQDLNSLNHVYFDNRVVQQIRLEPGRAVRIADYHLALVAAEGTAEAEPATLPFEDIKEALSTLDAGWLEHMQAFQRALLRLDGPHQVLERLAQEFQRIARPELVAVGISGEEYRWDVSLTDQGEAAPPERLQGVDVNFTDDSSIRTWNPDGPEGETPRPSAPLCLLFPMKGRGGVLGHVYVQRPRPSPLPAPVQRYLAMLAAHAGLAWENLHLQAHRLTQKVFEQELHQARQIQIELFPATIDVDERLNAYAVNLPSVQVSGDYYDLVRTGPDQVAFVIADAMGHGLPAALLMAAVRAALRMGLTLGLDWADIFRGLDNVIIQARAGTFVTGVVGQLDLARRRLQLVSAGHQPPSVLAGGRVVPLPPACQTRPWGLDFECPWEVCDISLGDDDWSILCYTDGITDAAKRTRDVFGRQRVAAFHLRNRHLGAEDLCQGLLSEVSAHQGTATLEDDQTVLVLRSPVPAPRKPGTAEMVVLPEQTR